MDVSTRNQNRFQASAQRKFYQWVLKWINAHDDEEMRDVRLPGKFDVPVLTSFLQAIGFKLVSFEKHHDPLVTNKNEINADAEEKKGSLRIAIECDASNMKAILELGEIVCQCPKPDHVKEASFWSISGTGTTVNSDNIVRKVEETGSNLLPRLSKDVTRVLRDVSFRLFDTITCAPDVNSNNGHDASKKDTGMIRSHTQPEIRLHGTNYAVKDSLGNAKTNSNSSLNCAASPAKSSLCTLKRQQTWDIETDAGPRKSSPKPLELYASMGNISLQDENENIADVADYIIGAHQKLEKALQMLTVNKRKLERQTTHDLSPNLDNDDASVKSAPGNVSPNIVVGPHKPTRSGTITNIKPVSKLSHLMAEQGRKSPGNVTPTNRSKPDLTRSKSTTRLNANLPQHSLLPRRNSLYTPSPTNSTTSQKSSGQKPTARRSISKTNLTVDTNLSSRTSANKTSSPVQQSVYFPNTNNRLSLLKPPTKISKAI